MLFNEEKLDDLMRAVRANTTYILEVRNKLNAIEQRLDELDCKLHCFYESVIEDINDNDEYCGEGEYCPYCEEYDVCGGCSEHDEEENINTESELKEQKSDIEDHKKILRETYERFVDILNKTGHSRKVSEKDNYKEKKQDVHVVEIDLGSLKRLLRDYLDF